MFINCQLVTPFKSCVTRKYPLLNQSVAPSWRRQPPKMAGQDFIIPTQYQQDTITHFVKIVRYLSRLCFFFLSLQECCCRCRFCSSRCSCTRAFRSCGTCTASHWCATSWDWPSATRPSPWSRCGCSRPKPPPASWPATRCTSSSWLASSGSTWCRSISTGRLGGWF